MNTLTPEYVAGLFDGEGCISINPKGEGQLQRSLRLAMCWKPLIDTLHLQYGGHVYPQKKVKKHFKQSWHWCLTKKSDMLRLLHDIIPHLHEKREQAEVMYAICKLPHAKKEPNADVVLWAMAELKKLKERDFPVV